MRGGSSSGHCETACGVALTASARPVTVPPNRSMASVFSMAQLNHALLLNASMFYRRKTMLSGMGSYADRFKAGLARPGKTRRGVADAMGITPQAVRAILIGETKSATATNNAAAASYFGCHPTWLATGHGHPNWQDESPVGGAPTQIRGGLAHLPILSPATVTPSHKWGDIVPTSTPDVFSVALPDDSMAPDLPKGSVITFAAATTAKSGEGVLLTDKDGSMYFRQYRARTATAWQAVAKNPDYLPLDSVIDGLTVIAVMTRRHVEGSML